MRCLALLFVLVFHGVCAETIQGKVIRIVDGDTLTVLDSGNHEFKIRLAGIDAPERSQAHSETSRQNLARLAFGKLVTVEWHKRDRYGRLVGTVAAGKLDVGLAQVRAGQAWWFRQYAHEQSSFDRSRYQKAELEAKISQRGLWKARDPVPPWEWRATRGSK